MSFDWGKNAPATESFGVMSEDLDTSLEGFDSEVAPEDKKWLTSDKRRLEQLALQERQATKKVEQPVMDTLGMIGLNDFDVPPDEDNQLSEVEFRLEKAQCYKMLINHQLLSGDSKAAEEVEIEVQEFVRERLGQLMGMAAKASPIIAPPQFSEDETTALKAVASKVLGKPSIIAATPKPAQVLTPAPVMAKSSVTPAPAPASSSETKRPRGRPRKYPCENCGQIVCICKAPKDRDTVVAKTNGPITVAQPGKPVIETLPDGTRIKHVGDRRYKLVRKTVQYKDGTFGEADIEMDVTPRPKPKGAKPYPTEAEVALLAQAEAGIIQSKSSNLIKGLTEVSIAKQQGEVENDEHAS